MGWIVFWSIYGVTSALSWGIIAYRGGPKRYEVGELIGAIFFPWLALACQIGAMIRERSHP